ncbi:hypothetical protein [Brevibacillus porteri]|uniref:hypothetical protein n=1 Tax=Brevibacillus porteri TaxID=2126350 RepID=UPI003D1DA907
MLEKTHNSGNVEFVKKRYKKCTGEKAEKYGELKDLWSIEAIKRSVISGLDIACEGGFQKLFSQVVYHKNKWISPALSEFIDITLKHTKGWS